MMGCLLGGPSHLGVLLENPVEELQERESAFAFFLHPTLRQIRLIRHEVHHLLQGLKVEVLLRYLLVLVRVLLVLLPGLQTVHCTLPSPRPGPRRPRSSLARVTGGHSPIALDRVHLLGPLLGGLLPPLPLPALVR